MTTLEEVPVWPEIKAIIDARGNGEVLLNGISYPITSPHAEAGRAAVRDFVINEAAIKLGRPVRVHTTDDTGEWDLILYPDGTTHDVTPTRKQRRQPTPESQIPAPVTDTSQDLEPLSPEHSTGLIWQGQATTAPNPQNAIPTEPTLGALLADPEPNPTPAYPTPQAQTTMQSQPQISSAPLTLRPSQLPSFLQQSVIERPATQGVRGILTRVGITAAPSEAERSERIDASAVSQHWPGARTIAIVNGKGGANKTPTTALLAAVFARYGGAGVLAWDNNETRGTLGWRTEQAPHGAHVHDLLRDAPRLQSADAHLGAIDAFVHHQSLDRYAVLRSNPELLAHVSRLSADSFDTIHQIAKRYFRLIFIDSGNDESSENWRQMIDRADHIVVASTTRPEHAEAARLLLDALHNRDQRSADLAANATMIISQADKEEVAADHIAESFAQAVRAAVTIPYDRAMRNAHLNYDSLAPATARAWLHAGARVAAAL